MDAPERLPALDLLQPGDVLIFSRSSLFNTIIKIKTWSRFTHVEVVGQWRGQKAAFASRNGKGVNVYPFDLHGLALVLRPFPRFMDGALDVAAGEAWMATVIGQKYDWLGLLNFTYARFVGNENHAMFCSEFALRYLRKLGCDPFALDPDTDEPEDADTISPRDFTISRCLTVIWRSSGELKKAIEKAEAEK